jgi:hypothetical protein
MKQVRTADLTNAAPVAGPGRRTPATMLALDERDALLVEIARRFYGGLSHRETAHRLRRSWLLYRQGRWRRTYTELRCPHDAERLDAALWCLLRIRDSLPSERLIRLVLSRST